MKTTVRISRLVILLRIWLVVTILAFGLMVPPASAAPRGTIVTGTLLTDTTWAPEGNPYQVYEYVDVPVGVTLTIEAGVTVVNYAGATGSDSYNFDVEGRLIANGMDVLPIYFTPGPAGWSGISITGASEAINTGSSLDYVVLEGGGYGGSGVSANLRLQYAVVDVHHCQFNDSPGDGILGDDSGGQGSANIYDSSFTNNQGYAVNFEDGSVNPVLSNLTATGNGLLLPYEGNLVVINDGTLQGAHTWENMGLPYLILQTTVGPDSVLTIEPGVQVLAQPGNDNLDVEGSLVANGTASQEIHLDPAAPESGWSGVAIMGTDTQPSTGNVLNYVTITEGGFDGNCDLYVTYGDASVTNSILESGQDSGVCLDTGASLTMSDTQLTNNQKYAMDVWDAGAQFILDNLTATGNMSDTIGIEGGIMTGVHTWSKSGINTYDLHYGAVTIAPTGTLTIEPGVTVLFEVTRDLTVHGTLTALGTASNPILFSGELATPGLWAGINFEGTSEQHAIGQLVYATIEYGGYGGAAMISIQEADVTFNHCILRYGSGDAIEILPDLRLAPLPAAAQADLPIQISWSSLDGMGGYAINNGSSQTALATYNWWGSASGPTAPDNPNGTGSAINGSVVYKPYLTAPGKMSLFLPLAIK
jgi:hypothetical protein